MLFTMVLDTFLSFKNTILKDAIIEIISGTKYTLSIRMVSNLLFARMVSYTPQDLRDSLAELIIENKKKYAVVSD